MVPLLGALHGRKAHDFGVCWHDYSTVSFTDLQKVVRSQTPKIRLGFLGGGKMGEKSLKAFLDQPHTEVTALCDPDSERLAKMQSWVRAATNQTQTPALFSDFRHVCESSNVDAIVINTPDHWHALNLIYACQSGKDVYCEKPLSHNITEGKRMVEVAQQTQRVVQVGNWQRSFGHVQEAVHAVQSGIIGKVSLCRAWKVQEPDVARMGNMPPASPPPNLDYDLWLGPANALPYQPNRCHYNFRWYFEFASGMTGDWGVHWLDTVLLAMREASGALPTPRKVSAMGGKYFASDTDDRTAPDTLIALCEFSDWLLHWEVRVGSQTIGLDGGRDHGAVFIGEMGRILIDRKGWTLFDNNGVVQEKPNFFDSQNQAQNGLGSHVKDFLDCVVSRNTPKASITEAHRVASLCHLINLAYLSKQTLEWDAEKEIITNCPEAMEFLPYKRHYRAPWVL
jgi:predicted dehydrogenase